MAGIQSRVGAPSNDGTRYRYKTRDDIVVANHSVLLLSNSLDGRNIYPKAGVIGQVLLAALNLLLDPLNSAFVVWVELASIMQGKVTGLTADIIGVGVVKTAFSISMAGTPGVESIVVLTIMARLDILSQVTTVE